MMKKNLPHLIVLFAALLISYAYFSPLLEGKKLNAHDQLTASGGAQEMKSHYEKTSEITHWTNSMFGGMPGYTIWDINKNFFFKAKFAVENIGQHPVSLVVLLILGAYLCLILFGLSPWLSIVGAIAYGLATHFFVLIDAGHITKVLALAYLPPLLGSIYYTFNKSQTIGALLTSIFLALEISSSHPQMTYYGLIAVLIFGFVYLFTEVKAKNTSKFILSVSFLVLAVILAVGINSKYLLIMQEYSKYSTRGKNELTVSGNKGETGLAKDYILDYSYDLSETLTAFIPRIKGGSMSEPLGENSNLYKELSKSQGQQQAKKILQSMPLYWGSQPIVSGPFYFGAIIIFLFVLGLFVVKGREKWWLAAVVAISFLLSLGKYFPALSNFALEYIPLYNKFRDVKNIVFVQCLAMWILGMLAVKEIFQEKKLTEKKHIDGLKYATIITGGVALLLAIIPTLVGSFKGSVDEQLAASGWPSQLLDLLHNDRISVARADAFRSLVFVLLSAGLIWITLKKKLAAKYALIIAAVLVLADLMPVNKRYLKNDDFVSSRKVSDTFSPTKADQFILSDPSPNYRVLNIAVSTFNDASTSYHHKSIGGYSGAKMNRYQDLIEHQISKDMSTLSKRLQSVSSQDDMNTIFDGLNSLNMLNTKYVIYNPEAAPLLNNNQLGNAWFTPEIKQVASAKEEIESIYMIPIGTTAIIHKEYNDFIANKRFIADSTASITLTSYSPNKLVYTSKCASEQVAVFSEIYYPKGWISTIDGKETPHFRANYVLRSMIVPAGTHEIVFEFKPKSYTIGTNISLASSILLLLAIAGAIYYTIRTKRKE